MPPTQLDQIQADIRVIRLQLQQHTSQLNGLARGEDITMATVAEFAAQLDAATTAEAAALAAQSAQIDAVKAELQSLFDRLLAAGTPQSALDSLAASVAKLGGTQDVLAAQSARLTDMAHDPVNPVPTPPPAG